jgi:hypothetical protein
MTTRLVLSSLLTALLLAAASAAQAQAWQWKDEQGRMQFSDQPPPANIKPENILRTPAGLVARPTATGKQRITYDDPTAKSAEDKKADGKAPAADKAAAVAKDGKAADGKPATKDDKPLTTAEKEKDFQKRKQAQAEAEEKVTKEAAVAKEKQQACTAARNNLAALESGQRITRPNAKGEREFLDDSARAAEATRMRDMASKACS